MTKQINGFAVNPIGIGTWKMGGDFGDPNQDIEAIKYSLSKGQNHIDTAEAYSDGEAERIVGEAIRGFDRSKLFIASKVWRSNAHRDRVAPAVEAMLMRLGIDYLDLLYIHSNWPGMEGYLDGMNQAAAAGLVKGLGVSNFDRRELEIAMNMSKHPIVAIQNHYNVLYREEMPVDFLQFCRQHSVAVVAYRPIERGQLEQSAIQEIASKYHTTPAQVALAWLIQQDNIHAIPKASNNKHINENLDSLELKLSPEDLQRLNDK